MADHGDLWADTGTTTSNTANTRTPTIATAAAVLVWSDKAAFCPCCAWAVLCDRSGSPRPMQDAVSLIIGG